MQRRRKKVGIAAPDASVGLPARPSAVSGSLTRLAIAALCAFVPLGGSYELVRMLVERTEPASLFAMFGGWQLNAMAAGLGVALLALLVVSLVVSVRMYRGLRGQTRHRRVVVMAALLPGIFLGTLLNGPMRSAIGWASDHTATAQRMNAAIRQMMPTNPASPPVMSFGGTPASPVLAARLLQRADLGPGWYDTERPNPSGISDSPAGPVTGAGTRLSQWHWDGRMWAAGELASEQMYVLTSAADVQRQLTFARRSATSTVRIGGAAVYEHDVNMASVQSRAASFALGNEVFTLNVTGTSGTAEFNAIVAKAVQRATTGR